MYFNKQELFLGARKNLEQFWIYSYKSVLWSELMLISWLMVDELLQKSLLKKPAGSTLSTVRKLLLSDEISACDWDFWPRCLVLLCSIFFPVVKILGFLPECFTRNFLLWEWEVANLSYRWKFCTFFQRPRFKVLQNWMTSFMKIFWKWLF